MDWKDLLSQKIASGEIDREEFIEEKPTQAKEPETIEVILDKKGRKGKTATLAVGFKCDENNCVATEIAPLNRRIGPLWRDSHPGRPQRRVEKTAL